MNAAAELAQARVATHSREELLVAAAQASRLLLESSDVMSRMPEILQVFGEAAGVDRTTLALADVGSDGERWLEIKSQWNAPGIPALEGCNAGSAWNARRADCFCSELAAGRSVFLCGSDTSRVDSSIASREAKSSIIVPFLVEGEYAGAVSFDTLRMERRFDAAVVAALEIAASVVGAALQRERLVETMRRERETASELRVAELARVNAVLRSNVERMAMHPTEFFDHALIEACRHVDAGTATAVVANYESDGWTVGTHACDGATSKPPFAANVPASDSTFMQYIAALREPLHIELRDGEPLTGAWPELLAYHRERGHSSLYLLPLVFGERTIGVVALGFRSHQSLRSEQAELLIALGQQVTLALAMKRLFNSSKQAAVLAERNRIGREIHDGLAQAFTGILMQLGAAEELAKGSPITAVMNRIRDIAQGRADRGASLGARPAARRTAARRPRARAAPARGTVDRRRAHRHEVRRRRRDGPAAGARARAAAHRAGSGHQRGAPRAAEDHRDPSRPGWRGASAHHPRRRHGSVAAAGSLGAERLRPHQHARARRGHGRPPLDREPAGRRHGGHRARTAEGGKMSPATTAVTKIRVILADDHPVVRDGLAAIVNQQKDMSVVAEAGDGEDAVSLYEEHRPDVMVLDLRMPRRDGVSVVEEVLDKHPKARLLIMTTYDGDEDIFRSLSKGAKGYLLKDAPRQEILSAIRAVAADQPYTSGAIAAKALQRLARPSLTQRELDVLQQLAQGRSNKDIGRRLLITEGTAKTHVKAILTKLDAISRTEAVAVAHKRGLIRL